MSAHDPRPAGRPRKLVLRKIADGTIMGSAGTPSNPYVASTPSRPPVGPRHAATTPAVPTHEPIARRPSLMLPLEAEEVPAEDLEELEPDAIEEAHSNPRSREPSPVSRANEWRGAEAGAIAAMTPAAPSPAELPPLHSPHSPVPGWSAMLAQHASASASPRTVAPALDSSPRSSVAPVVASLSPTGAPRWALGGPRLSALSADSKLLAAGAALAAAMLLVAVGVLLGQRSATASGASAAATGTYPLVVEATAPVANPLPPAATALAAAARPTASAAAAESVEGTLTVDVQQLPAAPRPRPQGWSVVAAAPKAAPSGPEWTIAPPSRVHAASAGPVDPTSTPQGQASADPAAPVASAAAAVPEIPSAAPPPVDPLVQAVREDIREEEQRK